MESLLYAYFPFQLPKKKKKALLDKFKLQVQRIVVCVGNTSLNFNSYLG